MENKDSPVYPQTRLEDDGVFQPTEVQYFGLTKLEYFTAKAMAGLLANPNITSNDFMAVQDQAVYLAKATLEALSNEE